ncbi:MAG: hypothetical protein V2G48_00635 [bacterium JZ-2024 1]
MRNNQADSDFWKPKKDLFWRAWKMSVWLSLLLFFLLLATAEKPVIFSFALGSSFMLLDAYLFRILLEEAWLGKSKYRWLAGVGLILKYPLLFGIFIYMVRRYPPHYLHAIALFGGIGILPLLLGLKVLSLWLIGRLEDGTG